MINLCSEPAAPLHVTPFEFLDNLEELENICDLDMGKQYLDTMEEALIAGRVGPTIEISQCTNLGEDLNKDMGKIDNIINLELTRKRKLTNTWDHDYGVKKWKTQFLSNDDIMLMERYLHDKFTIPVKEFVNKFEWLELVKDSNDETNRHFRCGICSKYASAQNIKLADRDNIAKPGGIMFNWASRNFNAAKTHELGTLSITAD